MRLLLAMKNRTIANQLSTSIASVTVAEMGGFQTMGINTDNNISNDGMVSLIGLVRLGCLGNLD